MIITMEVSFEGARKKIVANDWLGGSDGGGDYGGGDYGGGDGGDGGGDF